MADILAHPTLHDAKAEARLGHEALLELLTALRFNDIERHTFVAVYVDEGHHHEWHRNRAVEDAKKLRASIDKFLAAMGEERPALTDTLKASVLLEAARPFYAAYEKQDSDIPDSDLDNEQPKHVTVTLGDIRALGRAIRQVERE